MPQHRTRTEVLATDPHPPHLYHISPQPHSHEPPPGTCAGDTGDVAGLTDEILHDGQNPKLVPGILHPIRQSG